MNCFECGTTEDIQQHHVVPKSRGGTKTVPLCYSCHEKAHGRTGKGLNHIKLTKEGLARRKKEGIKLGRAPYGFKHSVDRKNFLEVKQEQEVMKLTKKLRKSGARWKDCVASLNGMGYRNRSGGLWQVAALHKVCEEKT